jgi:hypothetical protein
VEEVLAVFLVLMNNLQEMVYKDQPQRLRAQQQQLVVAVAVQEIKA